MTKFLTAADIEQQREELGAKADAIYETAKAEDRPLSDEERAELERIQGEDGTGGELASLAADLKTKRAIEARQAAKLQAKLESGSVAPPTDSVSEEIDPYAGFKIPAVARTHKKLAAFDNTREGEKEAYVCGRAIASLLGHQPSSQWLDKNGFRADMSQGDNASAGTLVMGEMSTAIIRLVEEYGNARQQMSIQPMGSDRWSGPVRVTGMTAYPVAETTAANQGTNTGTKSQPTYKLIELVARKWKAWTKTSDELNDNSFVSIADQIATESATAFAYAEDNSSWNGDGTSTYHGIKGILAAVAAGSIYTPTAGAGTIAFADLAMSDFETMVGKLPDFAGIMPVWNISKEGYYASMHRLLMAAGGITPGDISAGGRPQFLSYDVRFTKVLPTTLADQASAKALTFGDLNMGAKLGSRNNVQLSVSTERFWDEDQIGIKATENFDVNIHSTGDASNAGAILVLQFPAN